MSDLRPHLRECLAGRACLVGVGNVDLGDDGLGVRLAERLERAGVARRVEGRGEGGSAVAPAGSGAALLVAGSTPEAHLTALSDGRFDTVVFLDAVEFGAPAGAVVWLEAEEIAARRPQVSTHKLSLGLLARWIEANGRTKARLLGVQPASLRPGQALSAPVQATLGLLTELLAGLGPASSNLGPRPAAAPC